jgi:hypothetical protein
MFTMWEKLWRQYRCGKLLDQDLVQAVIHALRDTDVTSLIPNLPEGYQDLLWRYVESGRVPWGLYYIPNVSDEEAASQRMAALEYNECVVAVIKAYFETNLPK